MRKQIADISLDTAGGSATAFGSFIQQESKDYARFVKDSNITPQ
ncbi:MAG: hypothetical protein JWQ88_881 [Rhodoferax sp.]|nr:hypothetical protein [Rhodoferax sp.]